MISQFFILSSRGDILINKDLRNELIKDTPEIFFREVRSNKQDVKPIFNKDGINYIYIIKQNLYFVITCRFNKSPSLLLEFLNQILKLIKDFCGIITEDAIRKNFILIYEIIDEMIDFGYPQLTSTEQVKEFILSKPEICDKAKQNHKSFFNSDIKKVNATFNPITKAEKTNEIFVDVIERINVLFNNSLTVLNQSIDGCIRMKSYLTGIPDVKLTFNNDIMFDDYNFHECVDDSQFSSYKNLALKPPAGEFVLMNYRMTKEFNLPFKCYSFLEKVSDYKVELILKVKSTIPKINTSQNVSIKFSVPSSSSSIYPQLTVKSDEQKVDYNSKEKYVEWKISKFKGDTELSLVTKMTLSNNIQMYQIKKEIGSIVMNFEINQINVSSLNIKNINIENTEKEKPEKWIRYICTSNSYITRL